MRLLQFLREPEAVFWVFVFPLLLAVVLGIAFKSQGTESVNVGVLEGQLDGLWISALDDAVGLRVIVYPNEELAQRKLRSGAIAILVEGPDEPSIRYDAQRPESEMARLRVEEALQRAAGRDDPLQISREVVTETGARYIDFLLPGLLGMNLMGTGIWGTGFALVDMRQKRLLKLFTVTPMRKTNFLLAQMLSRLIFLVAEVVVIVLFGTLVLDVPFLGSLLPFTTLCVLGAGCFSGIGLLLASRVQTIEGVSGLMNLVMMPMWLLSGVFFSYERYPEIFHPAIRVLPLTALNDGLRLVMLEGEGWGAIASGAIVLAVLTAVSFMVALRIFRWR